MSDTAILLENTLLSSVPGGSIGAALVREFAAEGARVFLAGRSEANVEAVAKQITERGGEAQISVIDTL